MDERTITEDGKVAVKIPYTPREWSREFHEAPERWKVLVCHRRSGKTTACINHLIRDAMKTRNSRFAYIAPYYKQAKSIAWDMLKYYSLPIPNIKVNESELRIDYPNGSRIQLFGADNPDALRGMALWGVIFDEYSQQPSSIFTEVIRPCLADHSGYAIWIGTPQGRNDFYRMYTQYGVSDDRWGELTDFQRKEIEDNFYTKMLKASESGILSDAELADAKRTMSMDEYNQEFECSFDASIKGAYYSGQLADARRLGRICDVPYRADLPVYTFWDLGISDYTSIIFAQKIDREIHVIDYYQNNGGELEMYATELKKKPYTYEKHFVPHDIMNRELSTGKSRLDILAKSLGADKMAVVPGISIKDGIEAARMIFPRCWFDKGKTGYLVDALACYTQEWDDHRGMFKDKPLHNWASHACLVAGTQVSTKDGLKNIEDIKIGDFVQTPVGLAEVLNAGPVKKAKKLIELTFNNGSTLVCTPEHKIFTTNGLVTADALRYTDEVLNLNHSLCKKLSSLEGTSLGFRDLIIEKTTGVSQGQVTYIEQFGNQSMERFLKDIAFTIKMEILSTIESKISSLLRAMSTMCFMPIVVNGSGAMQISRNYDLLEKNQRNGMPARKEENGIVSMERKLGKTRNGFVSFVKNVVGNIKHRILRDQDSVIKIVNKRLLEGEGEGTLVYDLTIKRHHCYLANGILVSNSDAFRYLAVGVRDDGMQGGKRIESKFTKNSFNLPKLLKKFRI